MTNAALLAVTMAGATPSWAQTTAPAQTAEAARSEFCRYAESTYKSVMEVAINGKRTPIADITFGVYRNGAAQRVITMAWAGKCDMTPFLRMEMTHLKQVESQQQVQK